MQNMTIGEIFGAVSGWVITHTLAVGIAFGLLVGGWALAQFISHRIRRRFSSNPGADETFAPVVAQAARYAIFITAIIFALAVLGVQVPAMLTILGAAFVGIAIGLRGILANVAAGLMILTMRPMSTGDYITGAGFSGTVTEVGLFNTLLKTSDGLYVFVPNSQIWGKPITNYSRETVRRFDLKVGIAYDADIDKARKILMEIATADERILSEPAAVVYVSDLGEYSVIMLLRIWVNTSDYLDVRYQFVELVKKAFDKNGIEIPERGRELIA